MDEEGNQFVAYFLPVDDTMRKRKRDEEEEMDYAPEDVYVGEGSRKEGERDCLRIDILSLQQKMSVLGKEKPPGMWLSSSVACTFKPPPQIKIPCQGKPQCLFLNKKTTQNLNSWSCQI